MKLFPDGSYRLMEEKVMQERDEMEIEEKSNRVNEIIVLDSDTEEEVVQKVRKKRFLRNSKQ